MEKLIGLGIFFAGIVAMAVGMGIGVRIFLFIIYYGSDD